MKPIFDPGRPIGRLFYCLISIVIAVLASHASPPATTTISDVVYRADGNPASGTLLISWPQFTSSDGKAVASASMSLTIGAGGAITVALVPNAGATPAGTFYRVVYKLDDGTTSTEYWSVPSTSPTTIAAIRSTVVAASVAAQFVTKSYVDTQVATKATDAAVVHLAGTESVSGIKQFAASPSVPNPVNATDVTNKSYVDNLTYPGIGLCATGQYIFGINNHSAPSCRSIGNLRFADQFPSIQLAITDAVANKDIFDPGKFQDGLGKVIDGVVECLNASAWAKK